MRGGVCLLLALSQLCHFDFVQRRRQDRLELPLLLRRLKAQQQSCSIRRVAARHASVALNRVRAAGLGGGRIVERTTGSVAVGSAARSCERRSASASCRSSELPCGDIATTQRVLCSSLGVDRLRTHRDAVGATSLPDLRRTSPSRAPVLAPAPRPHRSPITIQSQRRSPLRAPIVPIAPSESACTHGHTRRHAQTQARTNAGTHTHACITHFFEKTQAPPNRNRCAKPALTPRYHKTSPSNS